MMYISLISKSIVISISILVLGVIGFLLSWYSYYAEKKFCRTRRKMICDINDKISCTKAFTSVYGKTFGISNSSQVSNGNWLLNVHDPLLLVRYTAKYSFWK